MKTTKCPILLLSVLLVACGSGTTGHTSAFEPRSISWDNPYAGTATEKVTLSIWGGETQDSLDYLHMVESAFNKANPDAKYTLKIKPVSESAISGNWKENPSTAADLAIAADDQIPEMIAAQYLQPINNVDRKIPGLSDAIKTRNSEDSVTAATDETSNKLYGFPVSASNGYVLYYNTKHIKPEDTVSFERLLSAIKAASEKDGKSYQFGFPSGSGWYLDGWFRPAGFEVFGEATAKTVDCDWNGTAVDPEGVTVSGVDVASALVKLAHGEYERYWTSKKQELIMNQVADTDPNQVIATINGTWNYNGLKDAWGAENTACATLPTYHVDSVNKDYAMWSVKGFKIAVVNAASDNIVAACRFAEFLSNYESQVLRFDFLAEAPTNNESVKICDYSTNACVDALNRQWEKGGFIEKVNSYSWGPSNGLAEQLCKGNAGASSNFIVSGAGTKDVILNAEAIKAALDACVSKLSGSDA